MFYVLLIIIIVAMTILKSFLFRRKKRIEAEIFAEELSKKKY